MTMHWPQAQPSLNAFIAERDSRVMHYYWRLHMQLFVGKLHP